MIEYCSLVDKYLSLFTNVRRSDKAKVFNDGLDAVSDVLRPKHWYLNKKYNAYPIIIEEGKNE